LRTLCPADAFSTLGHIIIKSIKTGIDVQVQLQMLSYKLARLSGEIAPTTT